jgi:cell division protein FtsW (lipid II flippase)
LKIPAAIVIAVVACCWIFLPRIWFWLSWEVIAAGLVAFGCFGEWRIVRLPPEEEHKPENRSREKKYVLCVAVGVSMEFFALTHAIPEALKLSREVESIRLENSQLKAKLQPRSITIEQRSRFISRLEFEERKPVNVGFLVSDQETKDFGWQIRQLLNDAGYGPTAGPGFGLNMAGYRDTGVVILQVEAGKEVDVSSKIPRYVVVIGKAFNEIGVTNRITSKIDSANPGIRLNVLIPGKTP